VAAGETHKKRNGDRRAKAQTHH